MTGDAVSGPILAIDTCLAACSAAVLLPDGRAVARSEALGTGHAERVAPLVAELLAEAGVAARDLARIGVTVGPGSFMGCRVGISLAKGLALPRGVPCVPVTTTRAISLSADGPCLVLIDARRGQAYAQAFGGAGQEALSLISHEAAAALALSAPRVMGVGLSAILGGDRPDAFPDPTALALHARTAEPGRTSPLYLRAPDAKPSDAKPSARAPL